MDSISVNFALPSLPYGLRLVSHCACYINIVIHFINIDNGEYRVCKRKIAGG